MSGAWRWLLALTLAVLAAPLASAADPAFTLPFIKAEVMSTSRVIGGSVVPAGTLPMAVQLGAIRPAKADDGTGQRSELLQCGGSLIAPRWVLTAAHCLTGTTEDGRRWHMPREALAIRAGTLMLGAGGSLSRAQRLIIHETFREATATQGFRNDIALIELDTPLSGVPVAHLAGADYAASLLRPRQNAVTVIGWGDTAFVESTENNRQRPKEQIFKDQIALLSHTLLAAQLDILAPHYCQDARLNYDFAPDSSQICAGILNRCTADGHCADSCQGDSGGPLLLQTPLGPLQVGLVTGGWECGRRNVPGVYTSVSFYERWIRARVAEAVFVAPPAPVFTDVTTNLDSLVVPPRPDRPSLVPTVSVSIAGGSQQPVGGVLTATVVSNVPGRLLLFDQDAAGNGKLHFPNKLSRGQGRKRETITPNQPVILPDDQLDDFCLYLDQPAGKHRMIALVVPPNAAVDTVIQPYLDGRPIPGIDAWVHELSRKLSRGDVAVGEAPYEEEAGSAIGVLGRDQLLGNCVIPKGRSP